MALVQFLDVQMDDIEFQKGDIATGDSDVQVGDDQLGDGVRSNDSHMSGDKSDVSNANDSGLQPFPITLLPLLVIEKILFETVVAQTLSARLDEQECRNVISPHDHNLVAFCPLWEETLRSPVFRKRIFDRLARTEPNVLYKRQADPVRIQDFWANSEYSIVVTLNDKLYTMEPPAESTGWDDILQYLIFVFDMKINLPDNNDEDLLKVVCTNKRQLPAVDGLLDPFNILASRQDNLLYVASHTYTSSLAENRRDCKIFKLTSDGKFVASWAVGFHGDLRHSHGKIALDPSSQFLVFLAGRSVKVFNTSGFLLASIPLLDAWPSSIAVLCDATVVVNHMTEEPADGEDPSAKVIFVKAQQKSDGLLEYEDLSSAMSTVITLDSEQWYERGALLADSCGCIILVASETHLVLVDRERKIARAARSKETYSGRHYHFDESHGLLFVTRGDFCRAAPVRYNS